MPISSASWESYPWKNELKLQSERAVQHVLELLDDDYDGDHDPHAMLERSLTLAAFCVRRMVEKRLVTDAFANTSRKVRAFPARRGDSFRRPFLGRSGGPIFEGYVLDACDWVNLRPVDLANEIIHSSQLMVVDRESFAENGILIASDRHLTKRLLHLTMDEFSAFTQSVLDDRISMASDRWDPQTGDVTASRA